MSDRTDIKCVAQTSKMTITDELDFSDVSDLSDEFDYSRESIKRLEKYDVAYAAMFQLRINRKNQIYYECHFSNRTACGIYIGAGDCRSDTSNTIRHCKKCKQCHCEHCIDCYGNQTCFFCNIYTLDALDLVNVGDIRIILGLIL